MCYAYAALMEGAPFVMGAPNTTVDIPAMWQLAEQQRVPIAGKDFKTGQTLVKSGFSPILSTRCLGLNGWFSTNILGNRDGLVLDEPENFKTKEVSKLSTLETILRPEDQPDLYGDYYHKVRINYYPPRGDDKEGWDNIDIFDIALTEEEMARINALPQKPYYAVPHEPPAFVTTTMDYSQQT